MAAIFILSLACGLATAWLARGRGRAFLTWLIWGTLFAPFALPIVLMRPRRLNRG